MLWIAHLSNPWGVDLFTILMGQIFQNMGPHLGVLYTLRNLFQDFNLNSRTPLSANVEVLLIDEGLTQSKGRRHLSFAKQQSDKNLGKQESGFEASASNFWVGT